MYASSKGGVGKVFLLPYDAFTQILIEILQLCYSTVCVQKSCCIVETGTVRESAAPLLKVPESNVTVDTQFCSQKSRTLRRL